MPSWVCLSLVCLEKFAFWGPLLLFRFLWYVCACVVSGGAVLFFTYGSPSLSMLERVDDQRLRCQSC